ncbi:MAG: adenylate/guanylate cyclase domain-containing protein [Pseudomonadota bacterium]
MITRLTWLAGLTVTMIMIGLYAAAPRVVELARAAIHDVYQRAAPRVRDPATPIHVVDIDEASLRDRGQWPWPRTDMAELTDRLFDLGAVTIGFDVLFAEPDRTSPIAVAQNWQRFSGDAVSLDGFAGLPDHDVLFASALGAGPTVLALAGAAAENGNGPVPAPKAGIAYTGRLPAGALTTFDAALAPIAPLRETTSGFGGISLVSGADGITRSVPMVALYDGTLLPAFSVELLRVAQGAGSHILRTSEGSGQASGGAATPVAMRTGALEYPLDENGHFRIHFAQNRAERVTSAAEFFDSAVDLDALRGKVDGKIVLVGSSAQSLFDIRATPLSSNVPGVQLHADILEQIISGQFLVRPDWMRGFEVVLIIVVGVFVTGFAARERPMPGLVAALGSVGMLLLGGWLAFSQAGLVLNPFEPAVTALAVYLPATTINVIGKERARQAIRAQFNHFLPGEIVDEIAQDPDERLTPSGAARELSVMFVDMRGFSTVSEPMAPEAVVRMLNIYLSTVASTLDEAGATIDKFMGDSVMAFWNAPLPEPEHAACAVRAVLAVERALLKAGDKLAAEGLPRVEARLGVNTGRAYVGLMGSAERLNYSCVGDSVTLAARFEGLTRYYGTTNLIGELTARRVPDGYVAVDIDRVVVKGRTSAATVATVLPAGAEAARLDTVMKALRSAYLLQDWDRARSYCSELSKLKIGGVDTIRLATVYRFRIDTLARSSLPDDWDGNYEALTKEGDPALA